MNDFELILTSYDECDYFVVEIWFENNLIAILKDSEDIQFFNKEKYKSVLKSESFSSVVEKAIKKLNVGK